jgi:hypothetical protein
MRAASVEEHLCNFSGVGRYFDDVGVPAAGTPAFQRSLSTHI